MPYFALSSLPECPDFLMFQIPAARKEVFKDSLNLYQLIAIINRVAISYFGPSGHKVIMRKGVYLKDERVLRILRKNETNRGFHITSGKCRGKVAGGRGSHRFYWIGLATLRNSVSPVSGQRMAVQLTGTSRPTNAKKDGFYVTNYMKKIMKVSKYTRQISIYMTGTIHKTRGEPPGIRFGGNILRRSTS